MWELSIYLNEKTPLSYQDIYFIFKPPSLFILVINAQMTQHILDIYTDKSAPRCEKRYKHIYSNVSCRN